VKANLSHIAVVTIAVLLMLAGIGEIHAQTVSYNGSAQFSTGSYYFENSTNSFFLSNGLSMQSSRFTTSINVPYVVQSTPWISYTYVGGIPTGGTQNGEVYQSGRQDRQGSGRRQNAIPLADTTSYSKSGFSDPTISASFTILSNRYHRVIVSLNGNLKVPFANPSNGFGTGAWDTGVGVSVSKGIFQNMMVFANSMYWSLGDMDELELKDAVSYAVGLGFFINRGTVMFNSSLNGMTQVAEEFDAPISLNLGTGLNMYERISLNANVSTGLSEASPDFSFGLGWSIRL